MESPYARASAYYRLGFSLAVARRWPDALATLEHALAIGTRVENAAARTCKSGVVTLK